jgi:hypothetical protein
MLLIKKGMSPMPGERGDATLIATLLVTALLVVLSFMLVPYFVFIMQRDHVKTIATHALKEAEVAGAVTPAIQSRTAAKLASVGMGAVTKGGVAYPSFAGSTAVKVRRDAADPTIRLVVEYPASNLSRLMTAIGGASETSDGYYRIELFGRSEAYE